MVIESVIQAMTTMERVRVPPGVGVRVVAAIEDERK